MDSRGVVDYKVDAMTEDDNGLRLLFLVALPEGIAHTNIDHQTVSKLREETASLMQWLGKNSSFDIGKGGGEETLFPTKDEDEIKRWKLIPRSACVQYDQDWATFSILSLGISSGMVEAPPNNHSPKV